MSYSDYQVHVMGHVPYVGWATRSRATAMTRFTFCKKKKGSSQLCCLLFFYWFSGLMCCILLPMFTPVLVFESLCLNTRFKSPSMVTPTLWHPYLKLLGPHLRKHCPRVISFLVFFLGCLGPVVLFILWCNLFNHVSLKKKKKKKSD